MKRTLALVALLSVGSCAFAQKHPAITIGAVAGTLTLGLCSLNVSDKVDCLIAGGIAGVGLGGITGLVYVFADTNAQEPDPYLNEGDDSRYQSVTPPPPGLPPELQVDAGVPMPVADDAAAAAGADVPVDAAP
ncbi:MAG: hypothetical protein HOV81_10040 [Kofleriaceae bacterium]|nr:hypothetical protein [Kofleriaceae bacterium]